jgi:hypothetical protein
MKENKWKFDETYKYVLSKRSIIGPNCGFQDELRKYEVTLGLTTEEEFKELQKNIKYYYSKYA